MLVGLIVSSCSPVAGPLVSFPRVTSQLDWIGPCCQGVIELDPLSKCPASKYSYILGCLKGLGVQLAHSPLL